MRTSPERSRLSEASGLKLAPLSIRYRSLQVSPLRGEWIEMPYPVKFLKYSNRLASQRRDMPLYSHASPVFYSCSARSKWIGMMLFLHSIGALKCQSIRALERNAAHWKLAHVFFAQRRLPRDQKPVKQRLIRPDLEELRACSCSVSCRIVTGA